MAETNRFSKPVAFNKTNPQDQAILKYISRKNFSGFVKKLIHEHMTQSKPQNDVVEHPKLIEEQIHQEAPKQAVSGAQRLEQLKNAKPLINLQKN